MHDCKIIHVGYFNEIIKEQRTLKDHPFILLDHPAIEQEINHYLSQGYHIVNAFYNDGMWFILERDG